MLMFGDFPKKNGFASFFPPKKWCFPIPGVFLQLPRCRAAEGFGRQGHAAPGAHEAPGGGRRARRIFLGGSWEIGEIASGNSEL